MSSNTERGDISIMNSYLSNGVSKNDIDNYFKIDIETFIQEQHQLDEVEDGVLNQFLQKFCQLVWIIGDKYTECYHDNKRMIIKLVEQFLVYYFNLTYYYYNKLIENTPDVYDSNESKVIYENDVNSVYNLLITLSCFIGRVYYRQKYEHLKDMSFYELGNYIRMVENIPLSNEQLEENYDAETEVNITRAQIKNIIKMLSQGNVSSAIQNM